MAYLLQIGKDIPLKANSHFVSSHYRKMWLPLNKNCKAGSFKPPDPNVYTHSTPKADTLIGNENFIWAISCFLNVYTTQIRSIGVH